MVSNVSYEQRGERPTGDSTNRHQTDRNEPRGARDEEYDRDGLRGGNWDQDRQADGEKGIDNEHDAVDDQDGYEEHEPTLWCLWYGVKGRPPGNPPSIHLKVFNVTRDVLIASVLTGTGEGGSWPQDHELSALMHDTWMKAMVEKRINDSRHWKFPPPVEAKMLQEKIRQARNHVMSDTRITVDAFYDWSKDRKDLCDRLEKCDNFLALDLDEPLKNRWLSAVLVEGIYRAFFSSFSKLGHIEETQQLIMPLRPGLIILIAAMVRWAIRDHGKDSYNRSTRPRFEGKGLKKVYCALHERWYSSTEQTQNRRTERLTEMVKIRANINASDIGSDFEPEPPTDDDEDVGFHHINPTRRGGQPPQIQGAEEKGSCRVNGAGRDRMAKPNDVDSVIDPELLKLDLAGNSGLKYPDSTYGSSSPVPAGDGHQLFSREVVKAIDHPMDVEKMERSGKSYNTEESAEDSGTNETIVGKNGQGAPSQSIAEQAKSTLYPDPEAVGPEAHKEAPQQTDAADASIVGQKRKREESGDTGKKVTRPLAPRTTNARTGGGLKKGEYWAAFADSNKKHPSTKVKFHVEDTWESFFARVPANPDPRYSHMFGIGEGSGGERMVDDENKYREVWLPFVGNRKSVDAWWWSVPEEERE